MTPAQNITRHFQGDWHGSYGSFPAPNHSASDRGMTVKDGDDGDVLINSFNGGDALAVKDECRRLGLIPERSRANDNGAGTPWRETGSYIYADERAPLYRTIRIERAGAKKQFRAERLNEAGRWVAGMGKVRRVLYRLPEILAADHATVIYLTEGERKADKLASWGFVATAVAFGAKGWREEYATTLAGRTVAILPDNDDEGRGFAEQAARSITAAGGRAVIVTLPGLPPKGDIIDWQGTADELRALTDAAINPPVETFPIADLLAWAQTAPEPKAFTMAGFIPRGEVTLFTGPGGANKSTFGLQLCVCSAAGFSMLGIAVEPGRSLYITAEDDDRENHWRLSKIAGAIGTTLERLAGRLHVVSLRGRPNNELAIFDAEGRLRTAPAFHMLRSTIVATGAQLVVLDNVAHLFAGNENDRGQVTAFVNLLYQLCRDLGVTVILIGHPNKAGDSYSGSTAWLNAVRSQIVIQRPEGSSDPDVRQLTIGKANYARADQQLGFRWHDFALVRDEDLPTGMREELAATAVATGDNAIFLACLDARSRDGLVVSPNVSPNYAPSQFEAMPAAKGIGKDRLRSAMERLLSIGEIEVFDHENKVKGRTLKALRRASRISPNASPDASRTLFPNVPGQYSRTPPHTHPPSTRETGAAQEAAAPDQDRDDFDPFDSPSPNGRFG